MFTAAYPVPPLCKGIMSLSFMGYPLRGCVISFLTILSMHSMVTTSPVVFNTAQGVELLKTSWVTGHMYLSSLEMKLFLLSGSSRINVNFTSIKSFIFKGFRDMGQYIVFSGFLCLVAVAWGVSIGIQKEGRGASLLPAGFPLGPLEVPGVAAADDDDEEVSFFMLVKMLFSDSSNLESLLSFSAAAISAKSRLSRFFCLSYSLSFRAYSAFFSIMYLSIASLSKSHPSGVIMGVVRHGCNVKEQQSKPFSASLESRHFSVPKPEAAESFFRSL